MTGFAPYPGFDPCDDGDPRVSLAPDNPCRPDGARGALDADPVDALRIDPVAEAA